jgi:hypothetical protein
LTHLADAVENATITVAGADLNITAPKSYALYFKDRAFDTAVRTVFDRPLRINITVGEASPQNAALPQPAGASKAGSPDEDDATTRAMANPEVRRFREVFGGEVRKVRNLKE